MKLRVLAVGRLRDVGLRALCADYEARIRRHVPVEQIEAKTAAELPSKWGKNPWLVALDPRGEEPTSTGLSSMVSRWLECGRSEVVFVIGGADGLPDSVLKRADARLSLSKLTLPHRLARVLLLEQLYRALSILKNEPYAREN